MDRTGVEYVAEELHRSYNLLAPEFGYSATGPRGVKWEDMSPRYRNLMCAIVQSLNDRGIVR